MFKIFVCRYYIFIISYLILSWRIENHENSIRQNKTKQNKYLKYKKGGGFDELPQKTKDTLLPIYKSIQDLIEKIQNIRQDNPEFYMIISFYPEKNEDFPFKNRGEFYLIQSDSEDKNKFYMISNDSISETSRYNGLITIYINESKYTTDNDNEMSITRLFNNNIIHEINNEKISRTAFKVQFFIGHFFNKENFPVEYGNNYMKDTMQWHNIEKFNIDDNLLIPLKNCKKVSIPKEDTTTQTILNNTPTQDVTKMKPSPSPTKKSWLPFLNNKK